MARKRKSGGNDSKAEQVRQIAKKDRKLRNVDIVAALAAQGVEVTPNYVSIVRTKSGTSKKRKRGVKGRGRSAAMHTSNGVGLEQMREAAEMGAYLEFVTAFTREEKTIREYVEAIREIGPEHCIVSSDRGQGRGEEGHDGPIVTHVQGLAEAAAILRKNGFSEAELWLLRDNTAARRFYERQGWIGDDRERLGMPPTDAVEVRYVRAL